jgi:hypothetical protein
MKTNKSSLQKKKKKKGPIEAYFDVNKNKNKKSNILNPLICEGKQNLDLTPQLSVLLIALTIVLNTISFEPFLSYKLYKTKRKI